MGNWRKIIICAVALVALNSCGSDGYDPAESGRLCSLYDSGQNMNDDDYSALISQEQWAFDGIRTKMEALLDLGEPLAFSQEYIRLKGDTAFVSMVAMSERMWRVLVLSRPHFSIDNVSRFETLLDVRKIIDLYNDDIARRLSLD